MSYYAIMIFNVFNIKLCSARHYTQSNYFISVIVAILENATAIAIASLTLFAKVVKTLGFPI